MSEHSKNASNRKSKASASEEAIKLKLLERAEHRVKVKRAAAAGVSDSDQAFNEISKILLLEPHMRDPHTVSTAILYIAEVCLKHVLNPECIVRISVVCRDHFTHAVIMANVMYAFGCLADGPNRQSVDIHASLCVKCVIAALRSHQADAVLLSNGLFAIGKFCEASEKLRTLVAETEGVETILGSLKLHSYDNVLQSNGLMALARLCNLPMYHSMSDEELEHANATVKLCSKLQTLSIQSDALQFIFEAHEFHKGDPAFGRAFCDAVAALITNNEEIDENEITAFAALICQAMSTDFHPIERTRNNKPLPLDEQHGKDELVNAQGSEALSKMCLLKNLSRSAGQDLRVPFLVPCFELQIAIAESDGIQYLCDCIRQFPKKKDTVLRKAVAGLDILIKLNEQCQNAMVKHGGVDNIMASMQRWEEDTEYYMMCVRTLRTLLEGSDGYRNGWYLDTLRGREVAKSVIKIYASEGHRLSDREMQLAAQDMAKQWQSDTKRFTSNASSVADQITFKKTRNQRSAAPSRRSSVDSSASRRSSFDFTRRLSEDEPLMI